MSRRQATRDKDDARACRKAVCVWVPGRAGTASADSVDDMWRKAGQGDVRAHYGPGAMNCLGEGARRDCRQARVRLQKSADQGRAEAQDVMGTVCASGQGVRKDCQRTACRQTCRQTCRQGCGSKRLPARVSRWDCSPRTCERSWALACVGTTSLPDKRLARDCYGKACDNGLQAGCNAYRRLNEAGF